MKRDWSMARMKVDREGKCRVCDLRHDIEAAHVIPRSLGGSPGEAVIGVEVVPLCRFHHRQYDFHELDLLPFLTKDEQAQAVRIVGLVSAYELTTGDKVSKR